MSSEKIEIIYKDKNIQAYKYLNRSKYYFSRLLGYECVLKIKNSFIRSFVFSHDYFIISTNDVVSKENNKIDYDSFKFNSNHIKSVERTKYYTTIIFTEHSNILTEEYFYDRCYRYY